MCTGRLASRRSGPAGRRLRNRAGGIRGSESSHLPLKIYITPRHHIVRGFPWESASVEPSRRWPTRNGRPVRTPTAYEMPRTKFARWRTLSPEIAISRATRYTCGTPRRLGATSTPKDSRRRNLAPNRHDDRAPVNRSWRIHVYFLDALKTSGFVVL